MTAKYSILWMYQNLCQHVHDYWTALQMLYSFKYLCNEYLCWTFGESFLLLLRNRYLVGEFWWRVRTLFLGSCYELSETFRKTISPYTSLSNGWLFTTSHPWLKLAVPWSLLIWCTKGQYNLNLYFLMCISWFIFFILIYKCLGNTVFLCSLVMFLLWILFIFFFFLPILLLGFSCLSYWVIVLWTGWLCGEEENFPY